MIADHMTGGRYFSLPSFCKKYQESLSSYKLVDTTDMSSIDHVYKMEDVGEQDDNKAARGAPPSPSSSTPRNNHRLPLTTTTNRTTKPDARGSTTTTTTNYIVAVFVVTFDTKRGNEVEWQFPEDVDLSGVEFKALVSGSHTITEDFVYFKHNDDYGLSCYALKSVANEEERGARMKSVGIVCTTYTSLHEHQEFLELQVRQHLDLPFNYDNLIKYFTRYRSCPEQNNSFFQSPVKPTSAPVGVDDLTVMKITHPTGCFSQFIHFFGINIFVLWKFVLLQKRVLFFAPLPVGIQCYRVYCTGLLGSNAFGLLRTLGTDMLFFISVCRLSTLSSLNTYIACTTENILQTKTEAYDLYVDIQKLHCSNDYYRAITKMNGADKTRFNRLCKYTNEQLCMGSDVTDDEKMYTRFFIEQNNRLFKILYEVGSREDRTLTAEHVREMGLDWSGDYLFLKEVIEIYNINVTMEEFACCGG